MSSKVSLARPSTALPPSSSMQSTSSSSTWFGARYGAWASRPPPSTMLCKTSSWWSTDACPTSIDVELRDQQSLDPQEQHARSEAVALLYAALSELDPDKRAAFVLAELEEMTMAEVALAVGSNVNTVSSRVKAARRQFEAAVRRLRAKDD